MKKNNIKLANDWFQKAQADLDFALVGIKETEHFGQVCFLCQQAVEKYLKGFLVAKGERPRRIHSTSSLAKYCSKNDEGFKEFIDNCKILDRYYIPTRYPVSVKISYTREDAKQAINIAESIIQLTLKLLDERR